MKCKVGDTAWHIGGTENCGKLYEVLFPAPMGQIVRAPNGLRMLARHKNVWAVRCLFGPTRKTMRDGAEIWSEFGLAHDADLDPIRPPKITETETTDELEGVL